MSAAAPGASARAPLGEELLAASRAIAAMAAGRSLPAALAEAAVTRRPAGGAWPDASRAAIRHIAYDAARALGAARFVLAALAPRMPSPAVAALAHVALAQLMGARRPDAVVVDQAIEAARRDRALSPAAGFLNAVLRRFVRERSRWLAAIWRDEPARWNHPQWWIDQLRQDHPAHWQAVLALAAVPPPMTLRVNARQATRQAVLERLAQAGIEAQPAGEAGLVLREPRDVAQLPGFAEGLWSVQDLGAQHAASMLDARDGQRVLDACAAPGGKAAHLLERTDVELVALDVDAARLERVRDALVRLRLAACDEPAPGPGRRAVARPPSSGAPILRAAGGQPLRLQAADAADAASWWDGRPFDRILLDSPCSASGIVRRHPDVRWLRRRGDIETLSATQSRLLEALWPLLARGGKLLYATCSVFEAENTAVVERFVQRTPDCRLAGDAVRLLPSDAPDGPRDGFYYALLEKTN